MKIKKSYLLTIILILIFFLVLSPRINNPYPTHIDEWHHITESIQLNYKMPTGITATKAGFHLILFTLDKFTNLILIYKFLPAIWALLTVLILFKIIRNQTNHLKESFLISIATIIFFASLKSNPNILGLWYFVPLTFSIPFIYLYMHLFTKGIQEENKKLIIYSLIIMLFLIPIHSISVLFAIPILTIYLLTNKKFIKKEYKFFILFLLIPLIGIIFYGQIMDQKIIESAKSLITALQFQHGFGVLEANNSPFELYSPIGYILAILGIISITKNKELRGKYLIYIIWPILLVISIIIFKQTGTSYLSPYQRNLYYFAISLPFLSAMGLHSLIKKMHKKKILTLLAITIILILTFAQYYQLPERMQLYENINQDNYEALQFLKTQPRVKDTTVIAPALIATTIFPITQRQPLATTFFYGDRNLLFQFFLSEDCQTKNQIIENHDVAYVLSEQSIECNWEIIYNKNNNIIYKV